MFSLDPTNCNFVNTLDLFLKVLGGIGGIVLFFIGYCRYSKSQTWKKNEFVANEIKDFNSNTMVRNTMYMLDWNKRFIELFPDKPEYNERFVRVTRATLRSALLTHKIKANFKKEEVAIRDHFDCFLDYFEKFQQFIEAGLISKDELRPYLKYWIKRIGDDMESDVKNTIHHYINEYGYNGVQELFSEFGQDIIPKTRVESCLVREEELMETDNIEFESTI